MKKTVALLLAMALALTLFAACGGDSSDGDSNGDGGGSSAGGGGSAQSSVSVGDVIEFGVYDWRVLDIQDGRALILSENILTERAYHSPGGNITWEECDLREYLNGEFYENSFTTDEKARIAETRVTNNDNPWFGTPGGNRTIDRVFLLSIEEVVQYFGDSGQLQNRPLEHSLTDYDYGDYSGTYHTPVPSYSDYIDDEYNSARIAYEMSERRYAEIWWLRSPGGSSHYATYVIDDGVIDVDGDHLSLHYAGGVRPAMWIEL